MYTYTHAHKHAYINAYTHTYTHFLCHILHSSLTTSVPKKNNCRILKKNVRHFLSRFDFNPVLQNTECSLWPQLRLTLLSICPVVTQLHSFCNNCSLLYDQMIDTYMPCTYTQIYVNTCINIYSWKHRVYIWMHNQMVCVCVCVCPHEFICTTCVQEHVEANREHWLP